MCSRRRRLRGPAAALRTLAEPIPPRDLWARTAAALDQADRQAPRIFPDASVFPGRGGLPGIARLALDPRPARRASGDRIPFVAARRPAAALLRDRRANAGGSGLRWLAPFGALAAMALVIVVGGTAILTNTRLTPVSPIASCRDRRARRSSVGARSRRRSRSAPARLPG